MISTGDDGYSARMSTSTRKSLTSEVISSMGLHLPVFQNKKFTEPSSINYHFRMNYIFEKRAGIPLSIPNALMTSSISGQCTLSPFSIILKYFRLLRHDAPTLFQYRSDLLIRDGFALKPFIDGSCESNIVHGSLIASQYGIHFPSRISRSPRILLIPRSIEWNSCLPGYT